MITHVVCQHDMDYPPHSMRIDLVTFELSCGCCKIKMKDFSPKIEAFNRAMKIIKK